MEPAPSAAFPDGPPIPEMREALLDAENVRELVGDLSRFARVLSVQCKSRIRSHTGSASPMALEQAAELLLSRDLQAVQVRYFYDDHEWTDTLIGASEGVRLVRCRHERG
jgi:hypothetical protein